METGYLSQYKYQNNCNKICIMLCLFTEWFQQQNQFTTEFENMEVNEMNKCLSKFYVFARRKDSSFYKKTSLLSL